MKQLYLIYPLFFGLSIAYLISGFLEYKVRPPLHKVIIRKISIKNIDGDRSMIEDIVKSNPLNAYVGELQPRLVSKNSNSPKTSTIDGYSLVGFMRGKSPVALFKKKDKPLLIVGKKTAVDGWYLKNIVDSTVYLKNKITGQIKKFTIKTYEMKSVFEKYISPDINYNTIERITIQKATLRKKLSDFNRFLKNVQINPYFKGTKTIGYRISYLSKASILNKIGIKRGDIIVSVNGRPTSNTMQMMSLYSQLSNMTSVNLDILRNGKKKTIFVEVE